MITKEKKKEIARELSEKISKVNNLYFIDFSNMTVADSIDLRRAFKEKGVEYRVVKNTLIKRTLAGNSKFPFKDENYSGMTALAFGYDDALAPSKVLKQYLEKNKRETPKLKAAVVESQYYDGSKLKELASLPSRDELIAGILGSINAPVTGILGVVNSVMRDLIYLIEEVAKKKAA
jgi:large subunit ribosomal protein L10